jgi:uncharacterized glyoxalase superfamily protein PhnB
MIINRSVPTNSPLPHLAYEEIEAAIAWLGDTFGFTERYRYGDPIAGAQLAHGTALVMLERARGNRASPQQLGMNTQYLTIFVENVDAHFAHASSAGAAIFEALNDTIYGERQYGALDLEGHRWLFSQHVHDVAPGDWGATAPEER